MEPLGGAGVGGAEWGRRKAKSSNASAAVTSNDVEVGAEEGKRRGKSKYLVEKCDKICAQHSRCTRAPFRSVSLRTKPRQTRWNGPPDRSGPHWRTVGWLHLRNVACSMQRQRRRRRHALPTLVAFWSANCLTKCRELR